MSFCEFCGSRLEDGRQCGCPESEQARIRDAKSPPGYTPPSSPPKAGPDLPPPSFGPPAQGIPYQGQPEQYPPPAWESARYQPPADSWEDFSSQPPASGQEGFGGTPGNPGSNDQGLPPPRYGPPPPGAGYGQEQGGYRPQDYQAYYPGAPVRPGAKRTIAGFVRDPYGAAARAEALGPPAAFGLLGAQAVTFFLMVTVMLRGIGAATAAALFFGGIAGIALFYGLLLVCVKLAAIPIDARALLSTQAIASIPVSAASLAVLLFSLPPFNALTAFLMTLVVVFCGIASVLLLEMGLRAVMPPGFGNVRRLLCMASAYAATAGIVVLVCAGVGGDLLYDLIYPILYRWMW